MRLVSFTHEGRASFGAHTPQGIVDLGTEVCPDLRTALAQGLDLQLALSQAKHVIAEREISWLPPIPAPDKILCVGYNYKTHLLETKTPVPQYPSIFVRFPSSQVGHLQPMVRPFLSEKYDFEGELAVVIGRAGRHISHADALAHVAGYSCFAENSVRDYQRHAAQATPGKNFESSGAFGPCLVTTDEVGDLGAQTLTTRLNGQEVQRSRLDDLIFSVSDLVAYASSFTRLLPGDVIATGTPGGVGSGREPKLWMKPGDELEIEVSGVGVLRNPVVDEVQQGGRS